MLSFCHISVFFFHIDVVLVHINVDIIHMNVFFVLCDSKCRLLSFKFRLLAEEKGGKNEEVAEDFQVEMQGRNGLEGKYNPINNFWVGLYTFYLKINMLLVSKNLLINLSINQSIY